MTRFAFATAIATLALAGAAHAADLRAPITKAPPLAPVYNWSGFYVGVNAGLGVGQNAASLSIPAGLIAESTSLSPYGAIGGAQAGYNWQFGNWVLGVEADIQASGLEDDHSCLLLCRPTTIATIDQSLDWFGTVRGRVGYAFGSVLAYYTGGLAYGAVQTSITENFGAGPGTFSRSDTKTGWTLGSGVEAALGGNWTGKVEYLYVDLGDHDTNFTLLGAPQSFTSELRSHIVRAGLNYRFGGASLLAATPVYNWNGFYVGANLGSGFARSENLYNAAGVPPAPERYLAAANGFIGGAQIGFNWHAAPNWVFGIEADFQGSTQKDDEACLLFCIPTVPQFARIEQSLPWFGTVRGRIGYATGPALLYVTAGLAYGRVDTDISEFFGGTPFSVSFDETKTGWTVGAGVERPFDLFGLFGPGWTAKTEYLYVDLGEVTHTYTHAPIPVTVTSDVTNHIFRAGLNYRFGSGPVVARY